MGTTPARRRASPSRSRRRVRWGVVLLAVVAVLATLAAVTAWQARTAYANVRAAMPKVLELRDSALNGTPAASDTLEEVQAHTRAADRALGGPHWTLLAAAPVIGDDVTAARTAVGVADDLARGALADLVHATAAIDPATLTPVDGRIDLGPIEEARPRVVAAHESLTDAQTRLASVRTDTLARPIADNLESLTAQVEELTTLTATAVRAVELLPPMLGGSGERNYLLIVQNNAEPRATGGLAGALIQLRASDGLLEVVDHRPATEFGRFDDPVLELSESEFGLFGGLPARFLGNVTYTPDFPRSGEIAREMWRRGTGVLVDGVASVDPVALGYLLDATGPVAMPTGGELTGENAAQLLLNQVYLDIADPAQQDAVYEAAAGAVFQQVFSAQGADVGAAVAALDRAADEGRLMVWSADPEEQSRLADTTLGGALRGHAGDSPVVGVYVNDNSAAKTGYYQRLDAHVAETSCRPDGHADLTVTVTVSSTVPEPVSALPEAITGTGWSSTKGHIESTVFLYAPTGGQITEIRASDGNTAVSSNVHNGLAVVARKTDLAPGASVTLEYDVTMSETFSGPPQLRLTPGPSAESFSGSVSPCGES